MKTQKGGYQPTEKLYTSKPPVEIQIERNPVVPTPSFNLMDLTQLRQHFHRMGNRADRDLAQAKSEGLKAVQRSNRDFFKSVANYLDIADHIKMTEL